VPFDFVTDTSYCTVALSVSLALLFVELVSPAAVTVAVFVRLAPVASDFTFATTVYVTLATGSNLEIVSDRFPVCPVRLLPDHDHEEIHDGCTSLTTTPVAVIGPLFVTTMLHVVVPPATTDELPLLFVTATS